MKTQLSAVFVSAALLSGSFAYCNDAKPITTASKEITMTSSFKKIEVCSNVQLILTQGINKSTISVTGDQSVVPSVNVSIYKGVLSITSRKNLKNKQIKIYIPVNNLSSLNLGSFSSVTTEGVITLNELNVIVHNGSKVDLHLVGNFEIESGDDSEFVYEKYEKTKVVYLPQ